MSSDASWSARRPGTIPPALLRSALARVGESQGITLVLSPEEGEDFSLPGASADIQVEIGSEDDDDDEVTVGVIMASQPNEVEDEDDRFRLTISTSIGGTRELWEELFEAADAIATELGLVFEGGGDDDEGDAGARGTEGPVVDVFAIRAEVDLGDRSPNAKRRTETVTLEADPLATIAAADEEGMLESIERSLGWALSASPRREGFPSRDELAAWIDSRYWIVDRQQSSIRLRTTEEDEDDSVFVTVQISDHLVRLYVWPDLAIDHEEALTKSHELNIASIAIDSDGDWVLSARLRRQHLGPKAFLEELDELLDDVDHMVAEYGAEPNSEEPEDEDPGDD